MFLKNPQEIKKSNQIYIERKNLNFTKINSQKEQDFVFKTILIFKIILFTLSFVSLIKIGYVSKIRITRLREIKNSYLYEMSKFKSLSNRFDNLFSFNGEQRFMKDQDQKISRDILRVIWR